MQTNTFIYEKLPHNIRSKYIIHALGGLNGETYLNSIDGMEYYYQQGYRLFETDVNFTIDEKLVCTHKWYGSKYEEYLRDGKEIPTYNLFMSQKINQKYTPTSFKDIVKFMADHDDVYVMIDFANRGYDITRRLYLAVIADAEENKEILSRIIAGGHTKEMISAVKNIWKFKYINLYLASEAKLTERFGDIDGFINYCKAEGITSYSTAVKSITDDRMMQLKNSELISFAFTTDDTATADKLHEAGIDVIGTNAALGDS
jgi:glycerophosphoryl diester phosphodiesterase